MSHEAIAPPGWGYRPGTSMVPCTVDALPDLPFFRLLRSPENRLRAMADSIRRAGIDVTTVAPPHLVSRYRIHHDEAARIVLHAQRGAA